MEGDKRFLSAELMTDEGVFELSMNHSPCLLQKFITHLYNFSSKGSQCQLLLLSGGRSRQVVMRHSLLLPTAGIFFPQKQNDYLDKNGSSAPFQS